MVLSGSDGPDLLVKAHTAAELPETTTAPTMVQNHHFLKTEVSSLRASSLTCSRRRAETACLAAASSFFRRVSSTAAKFLARSISNSLFLDSSARAMDWECFWTTILS